MFDSLNKDTFAQREENVLQFWKQRNIFHRSIEQRKEDLNFSFNDGPPFATGLPHYGHLLAGTIKDVIPRYKTMKGFRVNRRFGWDCHGLPVENEIEKSHGLSGALAIEEYGIGRFNEECRKIVLRYTEEWKATVERMGRWVDFDRTYKTMDRTFMESVWWVFKQLFEKGLVYEGFKVMPFSAKMGTPLSNFEAGENYKEVDDPAVTVAFPLKDEPDTALLIWTTTPWTLLSNLAVAVGPEMEYVKVQDHERSGTYLLAKAALSRFYKKKEGYTVLETLQGKELMGRIYQPPFSHFQEREKEGAFRVLAADFVSTEEGTGIVHMAPAFGEDDFHACQSAGIQIVCPVDDNGQFTDAIPEYQGRFVKDADKEIIRSLKEAGRIFHHSTCRHRYPFCYRSDTPLIYKAVTTWFVGVESFRHRLVENNKKIQWTPSHIKEGRFGKWLENARDWAISRNRYWGTPIPLWRAEDGELYCVGSIDELQRLTGESIEDLHRHFIDDLTFEHKGKTFRRVTEVFDCWFESGSMPYAQQHYPFENEQAFEKGFPADFIAEGLDQTRGWFYTLLVLSTALFDEPAYKNVIVNGILLAEDGAKMSKRLKNYPEPMEVVNKYGADAIRLYLLNSPAVKGDDLCFSEKGVELVLRQVMLPMWNAYSFFITYARIYDWKPSQVEGFMPQGTLDQWMLSQLQQLIKEVEEGMNRYDLSQAVEPFVGFIGQLTNWYIRRSRRRFWDEKPSQDRDEAFQTLYIVLVELAKVAAPFVPFISEEMYRNLRGEEMAESVHLCDFPVVTPHWLNEGLNQAMGAIQTAVSLGHSLRKEHKMKVRQPLATAHLVSANQEVLDFFKSHGHLVIDELNVKGLEFHDDEKEFVCLQAKANFRSLGRKAGKKMPAVKVAIEALNQEQLEAILSGDPLSIEVEGETFELTQEDVEVARQVKGGWVAANDQAVTIALDTTLTEELLLEGLAREVVNKINTMRREAGFEVTDRVKVNLEATARLQHCYEQFHEYISGEVLAVDVHFGSGEGESWDHSQHWDLNGEAATISLKRVLPS